MILESLHIGPDEFTAATGWEPKPQGLCQGDLCVPAPGALLPDGSVDVTVAAERLGMPLVPDEARHLWALGPATFGGRALATADAADLTLPDRRGDEFSLSSLLGRKVILVAWASW